MDCMISRLNKVKVTDWNNKVQKKSPKRGFLKDQFTSNYKSIKNSATINCLALFRLPFSYCQL